ncbi:uncharacterized protein LOC133180209 [Saccostrea echinata]|uniref:uncharacterized protein LOC133180209 n=1 Tax=Saccostrea echinata TaxID=191078 RepID=UPI002A83ACDC|nr:uncharacterized protein LOC133180209 [Saccostrea echinata]
MVNNEGFLPFAILMIGHIQGQSDVCTVGQIKGRCDCNKYEICHGGVWQEQTVPNNEKFVTICSYCTEDDTKNGCSNSQREVTCESSVLSATNGIPLASSLSTNSLEIESTDSTKSTPVSTDSITSTPVSTDSTISTPVSTDSTASLPVSTDSATETAEDQMCPCDCEFMDQIAFWENADTQPEIEEEILLSKINEMKKELQVNTSELTSTKMKKISAPDSRTSASVAGYVGMVFIVVVLGSIVILDLPTLIIQFKGLWRRIRHF